MHRVHASSLLVKKPVKTVLEVGKLNVVLTLAVTEILFAGEGKQKKCLIETMMEIVSFFSYVSVA